MPPLQPEPGWPRIQTCSGMIWTADAGRGWLFGLGASWRRNYFLREERVEIHSFGSKSVRGKCWGQGILRTARWASVTLMTPGPAPWAALLSPAARRHGCNEHPLKVQKGQETPLCSLSESTLLRGCPAGCGRVISGAHSTGLSVPPAPLVLLFPIDLDLESRHFPVIFTPDFFQRCPHLRRSSEAALT